MLLQMLVPETAPDPVLCGAAE